METLKKFEELVGKVSPLEEGDPVYKAVEGLTDFSAKRNLIHVLTSLKKEVEDDKLTPEGVRFMLMAIVGNMRQLDGE